MPAGSCSRTWAACLPVGDAAAGRRGAWELVVAVPGRGRARALLRVLRRDLPGGLDHRGPRVRAPTADSHPSPSGSCRWPRCCRGRPRSSGGRTRFTTPRWSPARRRLHRTRCARSASAWCSVSTGRLRASPRAGCSSWRWGLRWPRRSWCPDEAQLVVAGARARTQVVRCSWSPSPCSRNATGASTSPTSRRCGHSGRRASPQRAHQQRGGRRLPQAPAPDRGSSLRSRRRPRAVVPAPVRRRRRLADRRRDPRRPWSSQDDRVLHDQADRERAELREWETLRGPSCVTVLAPSGPPAPHRARSRPPPASRRLPPRAAARTRSSPRAPAPTARSRGR